MIFFFLIKAFVSTIFFFFQAEDGIRDIGETGVQTCALPISARARLRQLPSLEPAAETGAGAQSVRARSLADHRDRAAVAARRPLGPPARHRGLAPPRRHAAMDRAGSGGLTHGARRLVEPAAFLDLDRGAAGAHGPHRGPRAGSEPEEGPELRPAAGESTCRSAHAPRGAGGLTSFLQSSDAPVRARYPVATLARAARPSGCYRPGAPCLARDPGGARPRGRWRDRLRRRGCALRRIRARVDGGGVSRQAGRARRGPAEHRGTRLPLLPPVVRAGPAHAPPQGPPSGPDDGRPGERLGAAPAARAASLPVAVSRHPSLGSGGPGGAGP